MKRRLRIAVSMFFVSIAVGFTALWIWNLWCHDTTAISRAEIHFVTNRIVFHIHPLPVTKIQFLQTTWIEDNPQYLRSVGQIDNRWGFGSTNDWGTRVYVTPHWLYILIAGVAAAIPWAPGRFSLRTMLIALTLVAVALGLAVWTAS